jgi:hypothetical protein
MRGLVLVLVALIAACAGQYHVRLDPPRPGITPQERVELFWKRRPTAQWRATSEGELVNQTLVLGDTPASGEELEVVSPEDLEPLVGPRSETMQHARRSVAARDRASRYRYAAIAVLLGGFATGVVLGEKLDGGLPWDWITFGFTAVTSGTLLMYQRRATGDELMWRKRAFSTYTRDLGTMLNVCAQGMKVVPCEEPETATR